MAYSGMIDRDELINSWEIFRDKMISALTGKGKQIMLHREKVIKGLEHCDFGVSDTCYEKECPYYQSHDCTDELKNDILVLLKEQEPRVMTLSEIERSEECIVWFEDDQFNKNTPYNYAVVDGIDQRNGWIWLRTVNNTGSQQRRDYESYGKRWRCWTKRPAEDQRKATKWKC